MHPELRSIWDASIYEHHYNSMPGGYRTPLLDLRSSSVLPQLLLATGAQVHHDEGSPLLLCDTCPRSFHLACVRDAHWGKLPVGDWSCPKCIERQALAVQRLAELEHQKRDALERCMRKSHRCRRPSCNFETLTLVLH